LGAEATKQEQLLAMLRRPEDATVAQIAEATSWAQHTVRGFFAGLKKKGHAVEVPDRVRQVGPNKTGAKGSHTVYALCGVKIMRSAGDSMAFFAAFGRDSLRIILAVVDILQHDQNLFRQQVLPFPMPREHQGRIGLS